MVSALSVYHRLPYPLRSGAASARGLYLATWRYGRATDRLVEQALAREHWSVDRWAGDTDSRLRRTLARAAREVPFYHAHGSGIATNGGSGDAVLDGWPLLDKETVRARPRDFVSTEHRRLLLFEDHTSGTSGTPLTVWQTRSAVRAWYALHEARTRQWHGVSRHDRWGIVGGQLVAPPDATRAPFWVWNAAMHQLYLSAYHIGPSTAAAYGKAIDEHKLRYLLGYPSALHALAMGLAESGYQPESLKVVLSNAEPLLDHQRSLISDVFGCPVRDTYGTAEAVVAASECEAGSLHLWPEAGVLEILSEDSDEPVTPGKIGRFVCTGLLNDAMPLIRYELGDTGALRPADQPCGCGRTLPVLDRVEGRHDDLVVTADGRSIGRLDPVFKADLPIREAQITQEAIGRFRIRIVPASGFDDHHAADLRQRLQDRVGPAEVTFELVDAIARDPNGKFKAVVSQVRADGSSAVSETERIRAVYADYRADDGRSRLWQADQPGNRAMVDERDRRVAALLDQASLGPRAECRVLDVGCGPGAVLGGLVELGFRAEHLVGVDLLTDRLVESHRDGSPLALLAADGSALPLRDATFDIALTYTVFSSIRDKVVMTRLAGELGRVLKPGGVLVWYDLRRDNPRNPNVHAMTRHDIERLFPGWPITLETCTLVPPLARRLGGATDPLYPLLARVGALRTHHVGLLTRPRRAEPQAR